MIHLPMKRARSLLLPLISVVVTAGHLHAQADPASEFFAAYQEFQRAEKLEREGRTKDAAAKFRYVASQLGQIKSQNPDWQAVVVDFRLKKTQEALIRLEGAAAPTTLGPPPDLAELPGDESLPPVQPAKVGPPPGPTISISADGGSGEAPPEVPVSPATDNAGRAEVDALRGQLAEEQNRSAGLEQKISEGETEIARVAGELEQAKAAVARLEEENAKKSEGKENPEAAAEIERLGKATKELEENLATVTAEKEKLSESAAESSKQIEDLNARLTAAQQEKDTAKSEAETAKKRTGELEAERESLVAERDGARQEAEKVRGEMGTLSARVTELEEEQKQLVAARDTAQKEAAEAKTALEKNAELIEANKQLEQKLAEAAQKITGMETDATAKAELIDGLQKDLDKIRNELVAAQGQLKDDRERFDKLQAVNDQLLKEYDRVTGALAAVQLGEVTAAEAKLLQQENEVLRGIIMRQIDEQARREQTYRLAQEEMQRLEIKSDTLNDKLNELAKPTLQLTEAEQEMLRRPVVTLLDADAAKMSAQVAVLKPKAEDGAAAAQPSESPVGDAAAQPSPAPDGAQAEVTPATEGAAAAESLKIEISSELMALVSEAREEFVKGNFVKAEELYQKFLQSQPDNVVALANLGVAQFRQGKLTAAQLALEKAVNVDPKDAFSLTTLGAVMIEQNRIQDAVGYLERANTSAPDDAITLNYLGVASSQLGEFGKAEQSLRRAITVKPEYAEAHFNLAVIYATAKPPSIALAKRHYEKALELGSSPDKRLAAMLQAAPGS
ncbi:MAG: repeat containing protein [Verrucomicrobiota bacterium]